MDAPASGGFLGIDQINSRVLNQNKMKRESKYYESLLGRFILVAIFFLSIGNSAFPQCADSDSLLPCHQNINFDPTCYATYTEANDVTALRTSGLRQVYDVSIDGALDTDITSMTITDIIVKNSACETIDGPYTAGTFPEAYGITFQNSVERMTRVNVAITDPPPGAGINYAVLPIGSHINFVVNAFNSSSTVIANRRYTFEIVGDSYIVGDTHIVTVDGVKYDFQAVGEFVTLRDDSGTFEIQTRQSAVATNGPGGDPYSGLSTCVSVNTAVAARVGSQRITYQPTLDGKPDPSGMELRIEGELTELGENGLTLESGGRIIRSAAGSGAIEIEFPNGASLLVTPAWWASYSLWYLNVSIKNAAATKGISGVIPYTDDLPGKTRRFRSWLPALPDGSTVGPMPESLHERYVTLYQTFADAWRVTDETSLFDYGSGTSTATYTDRNWPMENPQSCNVPGQTPMQPIERGVAEKLASKIVDPNLRQFAVFDIMVTGEEGFANAYLQTEQIQTNATTTIVYASKDTTKHGEQVTFTAVVARKFTARNEALTGSVEFKVDGKPFEQVNLERNGRAIFTTSALEEGQHQIVAAFVPESGSNVFPSTSAETTHMVIGGTSISDQWWLWLLILLIIIALARFVRKKKP